MDLTELVLKKLSFRNLYWGKDICISIKLMTISRPTDAETLFGAIILARTVVFWITLLIVKAYNKQVKYEKYLCPQCKSRVHAECLSLVYLSKCTGRRGHCRHERGWKSSGKPYQRDPSQLCVCLPSAPHNQPLTTTTGTRTIDSEHMSVQLIAAYLCLSRTNNWQPITSYLWASGCCQSDALHARLPLIHCVRVCVYVCVCVYT